ncbi:MAG: alanine--tRNA ligase [Proteobacteria bacterium]|nr:alanine--tRNA ligase [Pseudomonadota bacterium]
MKTEEIRSQFLKFYQSKGHTIVSSSSLVPAGDPTLLFANSGMVQFKDCFLGTDKRAYTRATTCQKSLRISGKHNDLENVGRTARHHTFFEMLGNFSFGDYFKSDAIKFAWEFITEVLELPKHKLWVTVYQEDDEAEKLWYENTDIVKGRVLRFGAKDNFWQMGETGPCGPCSEIFYYLGDNDKGQSEDEFRSTDGVYIEIWNLVFMQFNRDIKGTLTPLPKPSVDTGMGLERVAAVKQKVGSNYDIDLLRNIITFTEGLCGKKYDGRDYTARDTETDKQYGFDVAFRVIADHSRASCFLIADGVNPSSDGRGYVLRRLIRRACRYGRVLGLKEAFLYKVATKVISEMGDAYPELNASKEKIAKLLKVEEEKFLETLDTGMNILGSEIKAVKEKSSKILPGEVAFLLHDTYGFPLDLTEDLLKTSGLTVDHDGFSAAMERQRERSRSARAGDTELILQKAVKATPTKFVGYEFNEYESKIVGLYDTTGEIKVGKVGQEVVVVTSETPFYGESGGQIGDTGTITSNDATLDVVDTQKVAGDTFVHICKVVEGEVTANTQVRLAVDEKRRAKLRVNHSATHLLHLALREVLGDHVKQAGSRVSEKTLRFDFSHYEPITEKQLIEIEDIVNTEIQANHPIVTQVLPIEEAKKSGAVALFGEKYGESVRVIQIGPRSKEFCGGTHASRSGDIGFVSIIAESSVAAGARRIEAVAGFGAVQELHQKKKIIADVSGVLKTSEAELIERISKLVEEKKKLEQELDRFSSQIQAGRSADLVSKAVTLASGVKLVSGKVDNASPKQLREMADNLRSRLGSGCIALATIADGKAVMLTAVTDDLIKQYHAGNLLQELNKIVGGKGGGKADLAQAGGGDPEKIEQGLKRFQELIQ